MFKAGRSPVLRLPTFADFPFPHPRENLVVGVTQRRIKIAAVGPRNSGWKIVVDAAKAIGVIHGETAVAQLPLMASGDQLLSFGMLQCVGIAAHLPPCSSSSTAILFAITLSNHLSAASRVTSSQGRQFSIRSRTMSSISSSGRIEFCAFIRFRSAQGCAIPLQDPYRAQVAAIHSELVFLVELAARLADGADDRFWRRYCFKQHAAVVPTSAFISKPFGYRDV